MPTETKTTKPAAEDKTPVKAPAAKTDNSKPGGKKERVSITLTRTNLLVAKLDATVTGADAAFDLVDDLLVDRREGSKHPAIPALLEAEKALGQAVEQLALAKASIVDAKSAVEDVL